MKVAKGPGEVNALGVSARCWQSAWCTKAMWAKQSDKQGAKLHRHGPGRLVGMQGALQSEGRLGTRLHLHDDGFLGDFSLLLSDYKENSRNSEGYRSAGVWGLSYLSGMAV